MEGIHPHDLGTILDHQGVAIRAGHHCAQPVMEHFGVPATARASFALYNTTEEVEVLAAALHRARELFAMSDLRDLYQEVILDHNRRPRNFGPLPAANRRAEGHNPLCGDRVTVYLDLADGRLQDVAFEGAGCAISTASASLMTEALKGLTVEEARGLFKGFHELVTLGAAEGSPDAGQACRVHRRARVPDAGQVRHPRLARPDGGAGRAGSARHHGVGMMKTEQEIPKPQSRSLESADGVATATGPFEPSSEPSDVENGIVEALKTVFDPEIPVNIYELGLIYDIDIQAEGAVQVKMTLDLPRLSGGRQASPAR